MRKSLKLSKRISQAVCLAGTLLCASEMAHAGDFSQQDLANAEKLYRNRCAKCHKMYDPAKYTTQQWDIWMDKMGKKARLKGSQKEAVVEYVETTFRKARKEIEKSGTNNAPP